MGKFEYIKIKEFCKAKNTISKAKTKTQQTNNKQNDKEKILTMKEQISHI